MALRRLLFTDSASDGASNESSPTADEFAIGRITLNGIGNVGMNVNGTFLQNLPTPVLSGDAANKSYVDGRGAGAKQVEVNFGSSPVGEGRFTITDAGVTVNSYIAVNLSGQAPTGKDADELEMDALHLKATPGTGNFELFVRGLEGDLHGAFKFIYSVGT